jgi:hypothetical protein
LLLLGSAGIAQGQPAAQQRPAPAPAPVTQAQPVDPLTLDKLTWSTIAALDHANQTGNYSVLRDLGAPSFQTANSDATLAGIFESIRTRRLDLSNALVAAPSYQIQGINQQGLLRMRGFFPVRPTGIAFDLLYQNVGGQWRLLGISVGPVDLPAGQPAAPRR